MRQVESSHVSGCRGFARSILHFPQDFKGLLVGGFGFGVFSLRTVDQTNAIVDPAFASTILDFLTNFKCLLEGG